MMSALLRWKTVRELRIWLITIIHFGFGERLHVRQAQRLPLIQTRVSLRRLLPESCLRFLIHRMTDQSSSDGAQGTANQCGRLQTEFPNTL